MQPKLWPMLLLISLPLTSCNGPKLKVCVSDPPAGGFDCYDERTKESSFVPYGDSDKYVALDPTDAQTLFNYCAKGDMK